ncbi:MAG TPA: enoyl-CoA hydratase/isomerase family protein [Microthrixaceae bacterium]|nr:enoyl-CoA hydratase/isomerase family protein [Microthrixaceae bacterium]
MSDTPEAATSDTLVTVEHRDDGVAVVTLSHGKVNALCVALLDQLHDIAQDLTRHAPRAVVVTGGPKVFAAGADITEFAERGGAEPFALAPPDRVGEIGGAFLRALNAVAALPCPTVAAVAGVALGGGCELALACDFRIAGQGSRFGQPEILLGIIPGGGGTQRLARLVGPARAKDLVFTGRMVDSAEALEIGLVDRVVEDDKVVEAAIAQAAALAKGPRHALALAKSAIDEGLEVSLEQGLLLEQERFVQSFTTPDAAVGVRSFLAEGPGKAKFD